MADNEKQPSNVETFVDKLASGDNTGAGEAFKDAMRDKVGDALDTGRKEYASNLFNAARDVMTGTPSDGATEVAVDTSLGSKTRSCGTVYGTSYTGRSASCT